MVIIADPIRPLAYTPKGTPKRGVILDAYEKEIEDVYASFEETIPLNFPIPSTWTHASILELCRAVVQTVMSENVNDIQDDIDIFQLGCDRYLSIYTLVIYLTLYLVCMQIAYTTLWSNTSGGLTSMLAPSPVISYTPIRPLGSLLASSIRKQTPPLQHPTIAWQAKPFR